MAKKAETVDVTIYVKPLVDAGMTEAEAKDRVQKLVDKVNEVMAGESVEARNNIIGVKIKELIAVSKSEKYTMVVVAAAPKKDSNGYKRNTALKTYNDDRETALSQGLAKVVKEGTNGAMKAADGTWIVAIDNKKFWDEAGTKKNFGYGKPFPVRMSREIIGIANGSIVKAYGDVDVKAGGEYELLGKINEASGALYISNAVKPKLLKTLNSNDLYGMVLDAAKSYDKAMDLESALETDEKGTILVSGYTLNVAVSSNGKHRMTLNGGMGAEMMVFPTDDAAEKAISEVPVGSDIIAIGIVRDPKDTQYNRSMNAFHVIVNPKMGAAGKALDALKDYEF